MKGTGDLFFLGGVGEDVFGETFAGQIVRPDPLNKYLLLSQLKEYIRWQEKNGRFHDGYEYDKKKLHFFGAMKWFWAGTGVLFAGMVINPNFTSKHYSFYLRKFNVVLFGLIGYHWGRKKQDQHLLNMMLKMHDYFPLEIKRAI